MSPCPGLFWRQTLRFIHEAQRYRVWCYHPHSLPVKAIIVFALLSALRIASVSDVRNNQADMF